MLQNNKEEILFPYTSFTLVDLRDIKHSSELLIKEALILKFQALKNKLANLLIRACTKAILNGSVGLWT